MVVELDTTIFEVRTPDGHLYKISLRGRTEGFPKGSIIVNRALPLAYALQAGHCTVEE
jgi:hypothetical protein